MKYYAARSANFLEVAQLHRLRRLDPRNLERPDISCWEGRSPNL